MLQRRVIKELHDILGQPSYIFENTIHVDIYTSHALQKVGLMYLRITLPDYRVIHEIEYMCACKTYSNSEKFCIMFACAECSKRYGFIFFANTFSPLLTEHGRT